MCKVPGTIAPALALVALAGVALADQKSSGLRWYDWSYFSPQQATATTQPTPPPTTAEEERVATIDSPARLHKGVDEFFNVREAYSDLDACEWEFDAGAQWYTISDGQTDRVFLKQTLKYGITDSLHVALDVLEPLGTGGDGLGETYLTLFNTCWDEGEILPAFGSYFKMRIPTGHESSRVDGKWGGILTKTICPGIRGHFEGWIESANGTPGWFEEEWGYMADRRHFQWGLGPGFDFELAENTLLVLNYLHRVSELYGYHNNNILEAGLVHTFARTDRSYQQFKVACDLGLDGAGTTPNLGAKFLWEINWK